MPTAGAQQGHAAAMGWLPGLLSGRPAQQDDDGIAHVEKEDLLKFLGKRAPKGGSSAAGVGSGRDPPPRHGSNGGLLGFLGGAQGAAARRRRRLRAPAWRGGGGGSSFAAGISRLLLRGDALNRVLLAALVLW